AGKGEVAEFVDLRGTGGLSGLQVHQVAAEVPAFERFARILPGGQTQQDRSRDDRTDHKAPPHPHRPRSAGPPDGGTAALRLLRLAPTPDWLPRRIRPKENVVHFGTSEREIGKLLGDAEGGQALPAPELPLPQARPGFPGDGLERFDAELMQL